MRMHKHPIEFHDLHLPASQFRLYRVWHAWSNVIQQVILEKNQKTGDQIFVEPLDWQQCECSPKQLDRTSHSIPFSLIPISHSSPLRFISRQTWNFVEQLKDIRGSTRPGRNESWQRSAFSYSPKRQNFPTIYQALSMDRALRKKTELADPASQSCALNLCSG